MNWKRPTRLMVCLAGALVAAGRGWGADPVALAPVVTAATRLPESQALLGTDVSVISGPDMLREQQLTLADALATLAGGPVFAAGREGASASLFLRGANSDQVLFLVDGIRFSDANTAYGPFLGGWVMDPGDQVEVVRGAQSTLYGAEATGGVVSLSTLPGTGKPAESVEIEGGSLGTVNQTTQAAGSVGGWGYDSAVSAARTGNGRAHNDFKAETLALRLDRPVGPYLTTGVTLRGLNDSYGDPGDVYHPSALDAEKEQDWIGTVFGQALLSENLSGRLTLGGVYRRFRAHAPEYGPPDDTVTRNERGVIDGQVNGRLTAHNLLTAGFDLERAETSDDGFGAIDRHEGLAAVYLQDEYAPTPEIRLTGGLRRDDTSSFGGANTGRVALAWLGAGHSLKARGSYATGFNAPGFLDLFGRSAGFVGNPRLRPERSRGWDAGFDLYLPDDPRQVLALTWFRTDFRDLITTDFSASPATPVNIGRARSQGLEVAWTTPLAGAIQARFAYTYLLAEDLAAGGAPLLRRPRNSGTGDLFLNLRNGLTFGAGGAYVGRRADLDAQTFETFAAGGYTVLRAYGRYQWTRHLALHARIENVLNRAYVPVSGYPAPGRRYLGGAEWKF